MSAALPASSCANPAGQNRTQLFETVASNSCLRVVNTLHEARQDVKLRPCHLNQSVMTNQEWHRDVNLSTPHSRRPDSGPPYKLRLTVERPMLSMTDLQLTSFALATFNKSSSQMAPPRLAGKELELSYYR